MTFECSGWYLFDIVMSLHRCEQNKVPRLMVWHI